MSNGIDLQSVFQQLDELAVAGNRDKGLRMAWRDEIVAVTFVNQQ